jgi:hypothetical protein
LKLNRKETYEIIKNKMVQLITIEQEERKKWARNGCEKRKGSVASNPQTHRKHKRV